MVSFVMLPRDFSVFQVMYQERENPTGRDSKRGASNWTNSLVQDWMRNPSSLKRSWLPFIVSSAGLADSSFSNDSSLGDLDTAPQAFRSNITIVIQLNGEMANLLCKISFGYAVKWILEDEHNITARVVLRHANHTTWLRAWQSMRSCFPKTRMMDFSQGNTPEFKVRQKQQQRWLGDHGFELKSRAGLTVELKSTEGLSQLLEKLVLVVSNTGHPPPKVPVDANITLPFLYLDWYGSYDIVDRFYDRIRDLFEYDLNNPECCAPRALPNESVFHARGFLTEIPKGGKERGFEELSPNKTVKELLKNHLQGDKIAVLSRFPSFGQLYVDQMILSGLDARLVETSNGEQSFCFLMSGQTEIIGSTKSTYMTWASYLGNASKVRLYSLRSPERVALYGGNASVEYNFTHPILGRKISFESYSSEEQEQIDQLP